MFVLGSASAFFLPAFSHSHLCAGNVNQLTFKEEKPGITCPFLPSRYPSHRTLGQPCACLLGTCHSHRLRSRNLMASTSSLPEAFESRLSLAPTGFSQAAAHQCLSTPLFESSWTDNLMMSHNNFTTVPCTASFLGRNLPLTLIL